MKTIKFRAWHLLDKCWTDDVWTCYSGKFGFKKKTKVKLANDIVISRCSDHKDMNNQEMYEGDIVVYNSHHYIVSYHYRDFYLQGNNKLVNEIIIDEKCKIIGNIYETH